MQKVFALRSTEKSSGPKYFLVCCAAVAKKKRAAQGEGAARQGGLLKNPQKMFRDCLGRRIQCEKLDAPCSAD